MMLQVQPKMVLFYPTQPHFTSCELEPRNMPNPQSDECFKKLKEMSQVTNVICSF